MNNRNSINNKTSSTFHSWTNFHFLYSHKLVEVELGEQQELVEQGDEQQRGQQAAAHQRQQLKHHQQQRNNQEHKQQQGEIIFLL